MFDWNDQDQVGNTIWDEFAENEDHIVPYPKDTEENTLINFQDYGKNLKNEEGSTVLETTENSAGDGAEFPGCNQENNSAFGTKGEISAQQLDIEPWPDLPSLNGTLSKGYNDVNYQDSITAEFLNDLSETSNTNKMRVQLDSEPELFANDHDGKGADSFLDCDWANMGDFDDLDPIFSVNDSIFGHEMVGNTAEFFSSSSDLISTTAQSIPMPDMTLDIDQPSQGSSFHLNEILNGKAKVEEKAPDSIVESGEQTESKTQVTSQYHGAQNFPKKVDSGKKLLKSNKKVEERGKDIVPKSLNNTWSSSVVGNQEISSPSMHAVSRTHLPTFQTSVSNHQRRANPPDSLGQMYSSNQYPHPGYAFPAYPVPAIPVLPHGHGKSNKGKPITIGYNMFPSSLNHPNSFNKLSDEVSRPLPMTPREKIEKLRRRQQMQAMLAIQRQQQQLNHENETLVPQTCSPKKQSQGSITSALVDENTKQLSSSELNVLTEQDESQKMSVMLGDQFVEEKIYNQFQDALAKLDIRIRLCIRDSLYRLARSAMERQGASDRSSTNKSNTDEDELFSPGDTRNTDRITKALDVETGTNPIDRTVAHLLFYRPTESNPRPVKKEMPQSPTSFNAGPASNASLNSLAIASEENQENIGELEV